MKALAFILTLIAAPVMAQQCAPYEQARAALADRYGEERQSYGVSQGNLVEVYASDAGTWTILVTNAEGLSCIAASGAGYSETHENI